MKQILHAIIIFSLTLGLTFTGTLSAQEAEHSEDEGMPDVSAPVDDTDNPGIGLLDQATETKLRASTIADLSQVIILCQRAKKMGLSGDNLEYCNQLLAATQLTRGLFVAQELVKSGARPGGVRAEGAQELRRAALIDLEDAVSVIKDKPTPYLQIALLHLLPDGNENRAKEALKLAIQCGNSEPDVQLQAVLLLANLEPEPEQREAVLATAAKNGNPQIVLFHALTLFELKRNAEALTVLNELLETESGNHELHEKMIALLAEFKEYESAMTILDTLRAKSTDGERQYRLDLRKVGLFAKMKQYDEALQLLKSLSAGPQRNRELAMQTLELHCSIYLAMDNPEGALKEIEAAEKNYPDFPALLEQKYAILIELEQYADALAVARKLQSIDESPEGFLLEILALNELGEYDAALERARTLQEKYPGHETGWTMVFVDTYSAQGSYDKAMTLVEEQLEEHPDELRWIIAKNKILTKQKRWDDAVNWLESCLQKNPDSQALQLLLFETLLLSKQNYRGVRERLKPLLDKEPDNPLWLYFDSQASISLGLHFEAVKTLTKLIEANPEDYTSINNLAWVLCTSPIDSIRNGRRAVELAEQAGKLTQYKRAFVLSTLAAAYAEAGDFEKAREMSLKSIEVAKTERGKTEEEREELLEHLQKEWDCFSQDMPFRELLEEGK